MRERYKTESNWEVIKSHELTNEIRKVHIVSTIESHTTNSSNIIIEKCGAEYSEIGIQINVTIFACLLNMRRSRIKNPAGKVG